MTKPVQEVKHKNYSCLAHFKPGEEIDRAAKFERYPLYHIEDSLKSDDYQNKEICYYEIGANVGMSVILAGKMLEGGRGKVYSFEVEPTNYKRLIDNITLNELDNTVGLPLGIGGESSLMPFFINERHLVDDQPRVGEGVHSFHTFDRMDGWHSRKHSFTACIMPLDYIIDIFKMPPPTHVFIDAFGSEYDIVSGMAKTVESGTIDLFMVQIEEVGKYGEGENFTLENNNTYRFLNDRGYELCESKPLPGIEDFLRGYNCIFKKINKD